MAEQSAVRNPAVRIPSRMDALTEARAAGWKIAAVLPIHSPRALLRAFGVHPMEVWGPPGVESDLGSRHFQAYTCAIVRNAAGFLGGAGGRLVDCILVPHTCDSLQGLGCVLQGFVPTGRPVFTLYHPRGSDEAHVEFLARELRALAERLTSLAGGRPTDADLHHALDRESAADALFADLCRNRHAYDLNDRELYAALRSREFLGLDAFSALVRSLPRRPRRSGRVPLLMSGIVPEPMDLFDRVEGMGAQVVADDLACAGRRVYADNGDDDPYRRLARQLLSAPPDPTRGASVASRTAHLVEEMERSGARAALFYNVKFCEPELFFLPLQRQALEARGWPTLYLEEELPSRLPAQAANRLEAFLEVLS